MWFLHWTGKGGGRKVVGRRGGGEEGGKVGRKDGRKVPFVLTKLIKMLRDNVIYFQMYEAE